jgi:hypothetical protein
MSDRLFFALAFAVALAFVSLALQWPQGLGARSWGPFGQPTFAERTIHTRPATAPPLAPQAEAQLKGGL